MMIVSRLGVRRLLADGNLSEIGDQNKFESLDIALTAILILAVLIMWIVFSPFGIA
jgi:hypothetical protein